jgi:hypothetical protein
LPDNKILPWDLSARPTISRRDGDRHHVSTAARHRQVEDRADQQAVRNHQLIMLKMGDRKPTQFLRNFGTFATDIPGDFLHNICSSRLPINLQAIHAGQAEDGFDNAARCADRISEVASQQEPASDRALTDSNTPTAYQGPLPPGGGTQC